MSKKIAVVTGASSGIGGAISRMLCGEGFEVYGIGRDFSEAGNWEGESGKDSADSGAFHPVICDLLDTDRLLNEVRQIRKQGEIAMLVNNAGAGYYGLHEEIHPRKIQEMVRVNLEVPMILSQALLRDLKKQKGYLINISSVTAQKTNPHGCAYGATKAGLSGFSASLFEETRKYGVKVINIQPDMTKTNLYRNADFKEGEEEESYLLPEEVADVIRYVLNQREGVVATNITLQPQLHRIQKKKKTEDTKAHRLLM